MVECYERATSAMSEIYLEHTDNDGTSNNLPRSGQAGDLLASLTTGTFGVPLATATLFFCVGTDASGVALWAPVLLGVPAPGNVA